MESGLLAGLEPHAQHRLVLLEMGRLPGEIARIVAGRVEADGEPRVGLFSTSVDVRDESGAARDALADRLWRRAPIMLPPIPVEPIAVAL